MSAKPRPGNRSDAGAKTHAIITSLWQTCQQQGRDFLAVVTQLLSSTSSLTLEITRLRVGKVKLTYHRHRQQEMLEKRGGSNSAATAC